MTLSHKEMTAHIRKRLKVAGIKAKCALYTSCGTQWIRVAVPTFEARFSEDEQRTIRTIAKVNGLTRSMGSEINIELMTDPMELHFEYHSH